MDTRCHWLYRQYIGYELAILRMLSTPLGKNGR
jgi:hypothetical protein